MTRRLLRAFFALLLLFSLVSCSLFEKLDEKGYIAYNYDLSEYITLGQYRDLTVLQSEVTPTEEELQAQIESDFAPLMQLTDRALELGDTVVLSYTALFEGKEYDDDTEHGFRITLGENQLSIPGFDEGLIGAVPGDSVSLDLTFPADYDKNPDYAGKDVSFLVDVQYICLDLPELTDELVASYTASKTKEEYLQKTREALTEVKTIELLWKKVTDSSRVLQYPEKEYENYYNEFLQGYTSLAANYSMTLSEMITESGRTMDDFYDEADATTKNYLKEDMIVYSIIRAENITLSDEEYRAAVIDYYNSTASDYYISEELMEQTLGKEILTQQFLSNKVLDLILETSILTEG